MEKVISKDGTAIAFEKSGKGPAIILVVGAFNDRATGAPLAQFSNRISRCSTMTGGARRERRYLTVCH
jgi:hypothetical protein